jgi:hypothetical protein
MTSRRIISSERTVLDQPTASSPPEKSDITPAVEA